MLPTLLRPCASAHLCQASDVPYHPPKNIRNRGTNPIRAPLPGAQPLHLRTPPQPQLLPNAAERAATGADLAFPRTIRSDLPALHPPAPARPRAIATLAATEYAPHQTVRPHVHPHPNRTRSMRMVPATVVATLHHRRTPKTNAADRELSRSTPAPRNPDRSRPVLTYRPQSLSSRDRSRPVRYHTTAVAGPTLAAVARVPLRGTGAHPLANQRSAGYLFDRYTHQHEAYPPQPA